MSSFVGIDASQLAAAAEELGVAAAVVQRTVYRAINGVAAKTMTRARRDIVSQVKLTASYVRERLALRPAAPGRLRAVIAGRQRPTRLATYGARQLTVKAARAKGDALRAIAAGSKQAGVAANVTRGRAPRKIRGAFLMPLRAGGASGGNGMGIFTRTGTGPKDIRHRYGPSVDDVLAGVVLKIEGDVQLELEAAVVRQARYEFEKALKTS